MNPSQMASAVHAIAVLRICRSLPVYLVLSPPRGHAMPVGGLVQQLWTLAAARAEEEADHTEFVRLAEEWAGVEVVGEVAHAGR